VARLLPCRMRENGNILSISDGTYTTGYVYDSANQLIRENNQQLGFTQTWEYDNAGNITFRRKYAYTTGSLENLVPVQVHEMSGYGMYGMGDLFAEYDGQVMSYDAIGNPLYDGQWTYTWEHGRELKTMSRGETTWTYTYDANGMRTQRTGGYYTYSYIYNGSQLSQLTVVYDDGEHYEYHRLDFAYSANGTPLTVTYNDCTYHYVTNIQGDVIAILDDIGRLVCRYAYDAWGNVTDLGGRGDNVSYFNPLRYRGYVYDQETQLYYLQSRYYNPTWGRFLNADAFVSTGQGVLGNNMFAYCNNNPVMYVDPRGYFLGAAIDLLRTWLFKDGSKKEYDSDDKIVAALRKSKTIQNLIDEAKTKYHATGQTTFSGASELRSNDSLDLYLSTQHFSYEIVISTRTSTKKTLIGFIVWEQTIIERYATVTVIDTYDFDMKPWTGFGNILNNLACLAHDYLGIGRDYEWEASYETVLENCM